MALDKVLKIYDENGNPVDYDILASDVKFNDGKDLPTKLAEIEDEIGEGGYQPPATGIPKGDLEQSVQDTLDSVANKVDKENGKGLSTEDFTAALKAKLESLDPYTKAQVDAAIRQAVKGLGGGSVESITINGQTKTPDSQGNVDLGTIQGAKGDKGDKGDTVVVDPEGLAQFEIANDLDTSDPTQGLSARQGKILKQAISTVQANLQTVLDALANMAFIGNRPTLTAIDWTGGTFYATINKTLSGCEAQNMNTEQVAEGQQFSMVLSALTGYTLTGATISVTNSKGQSVAYTFDNSTLTIAAANVVGTITISVAAKAIHQISLGSGSRNVLFASGTVTEAVDGSSWTGTIEAASGHKLPASINVTMGGNPVTPTYNSTSGEITIANVTGNIVITAVALVGPLTVWPNKSLNANGCPVDDQGMCYTDFVKIESAQYALVWSYMTSAGGGNNKRNIVLYDKDKRALYGASYDRKWGMEWYTCNAANQRTIANTAFPATPFYVRASLSLENGALKEGCGLFQNGIGLFDADDVALANTNESVYSVTLNNVNTKVLKQDSNDFFQSEVLEGQPLELLIEATSGNIADMVYSVTEGGTDITDRCSLLTVSSTRRRLVVENVRGNIVVSTSIAQ